jgi:hypothetical protein
MRTITLHPRKRAKTVDGIRVLIKVYSGDTTLQGKLVGRVSRATKLHGNPYTWCAVQTRGGLRTTTYHRTQADAVRALLVDRAAGVSASSGTA